jgi:hypothetical protein
MDIGAITIIFVSLLLIFLGIIVHYGKCYNVIAGYNTLPKEQKKKIAKEKMIKISRGIKNLFCGLGFLLLIGLFVFHYFNIYQYFAYFVLITLAIFCIIAIFFVFSDFLTPTS